MEDRNIEDTRQPPDEPEAQFCEDCGEEMEEDKWGDWMKHYMKCTNVMCPSKFNAGEVALGMAVLIVEQKESIESLQSTLKYVRRKLAWTDEILAEREETIERLEKKITTLEFRRDEGE